MLLNITRMTYYINIITSWVLHAVAQVSFYLTCSWIYGCPYVKNLFTKNHNKVFVLWMRIIGYFIGCVVRCMDVRMWRINNDGYWNLRINSLSLWIIVIWLFYWMCGCIYLDMYVKLIMMVVGRPTFKSQTWLFDMKEYSK